MNRQQDVEAGTVLSSFAVSDVRTVDRRGSAIPWIEQEIRDSRATGAVRSLPLFLALKAEALHLANRTSEALETRNEAEAVAKRLQQRFYFPNCTVSAVCFSRLWVLRKRKLRLRFAQPSESRASRSLFR